MAILLLYLTLIEKLRAAVVAVNAKLSGKLSHVTEKDIEEAIWYYYFDVDRSVTWLQGI